MKKKKNPNRKVVVFAALLGTLTLTSALLLYLAPAPLTPDSATSLFAVDAPSSLDALFATQAPSTEARWKYIFVHHSQTLSGNATSLAQNDGDDHFVIGNGDGSADGEIQLTRRWNQQESIATPPTGVSRMDPSCISICLIGDFDQTRPTATQQRRLAQLVDALQSRLHISGNHVLTVDQPGTPAGIGHTFPLASFRSQILP